MRDGGGEGVELQDILRVAGVGLVIGLLHVFFEQTGKKEFSFFQRQQEYPQRHSQLRGTRLSHRNEPAWKHFHPAGSFRALRSFLRHIRRQSDPLQEFLL